MHVLTSVQIGLDETASAVDLDQTSAPMVFLSFSDSDLGAFARAYQVGKGPCLRLASLAQLRHPFSVDLYLDKVIAQAQIVVLRLLGGVDYWCYGFEEIARLAAEKGFFFIALSGDGRIDARLQKASTVSARVYERFNAYFQLGGSDNIGSCLDFMAETIGAPIKAELPKAVTVFTLLPRTDKLQVHQGKVLLLYYRSIHQAGDDAPIHALTTALRHRNIDVMQVAIVSLKDPEVIHALSDLLVLQKFDLIINTTAFCARDSDEATVLETANAPVLQVALAATTQAQWNGSARGLGGTDMTMHVALPEVDGRLFAGAISFKAQQPYNEALEFTGAFHEPAEDLITQVANRTKAWIDLRRKAPVERKLAFILSDYPAKSGRSGYAVGLDTPASLIHMQRVLIEQGYDLTPLPDGAILMAQLTEAPAVSVLSRQDYKKALAKMPEAFIQQVLDAWGEVEADSQLNDTGFAFRFYRSGKSLIAIQPDRGAAQDRREVYHDATLPPCHHYIAFYLWLRGIEQIDALVQWGTHGTLEWLPGKVLALSPECAPQALLGPVPVIYPFIVNNPGEAAQAKRRIGAVTIGHNTPKLIEAGAQGDLAEIDSLMEELAQAQLLDPKRAMLLRKVILKKSKASGLAQELKFPADETEALAKLDAFLCDVKEMRIGEGLHIYGLTSHSDDEASSCAENETAGFLAALNGGFVAPGPAGMPDQGRKDVLPTGRNLFMLDPRSVPTRMAWEQGRQMADAVLTRYAQDHGEWPRQAVIDLWASTGMRTGGEDFAQALALMGVRPRWDHRSTRLNGFEILPLAKLGRPRVDVTLRISGLFRDVFPDLCALFHNIVEALTLMDEAFDDNPLIGQKQPLRLFGVAPQSYGMGLTRKILQNQWQDPQQLGRTYLDANGYAYDAKGEAHRAIDAFSSQIAAADFFLHLQDLVGQDVLDADAYSESEGGFAAANAALGGGAPVYHADRTQTDVFRVKTLEEEVARVLRARAIHPRWIRGKMRHGYRGAMEFSETLDILYAFAALTSAVHSHHFDLLFAAYCEDDEVRDFLQSANPAAARAISERFSQAIERGFWRDRRNSTKAVLAEMADLSNQML